MIEVRIDPTGDWAEAESPEDARVAARTLLFEAMKSSPGRGMKPTASFFVDGRLVRSGVRPDDLLTLSA